MSATASPPAVSTQPTLRTIDITRLSFPSFLLGLANYGMFILALPLAFHGAAGIVTSHESVAAVAINFVLVLVGVYCAWVAWKNIGVLAALKNKHSGFAFSAMVAVFSPVALAAGFTLFRNLSSTPDDTGLTSWLALVNAGLGVITGLAGVLSLTWLRHLRIPVFGVRLRDFLDNTTINPAVYRYSLPARGRFRGIFYTVTGLLYLAAFDYLPVQLFENGREFLTRLSFLGYLLLLIARQAFQPDFDTVMTEDTRPPVLFLRSFADDQQVDFSKLARELLDFSLESRLALHFNAFGPFIAIGSPQDKKGAIHLGAARVQLADDAWQAAVTGWMDRSTLILCMAGWTHWVGWEMKNIIERGHAHKLVLVFPEVGKVKDRLSDAEMRLDRVRDAFADTPWATPLGKLALPTDIRCLVFQQTGDVTAIMSGLRARDSYSLAALLGHAEILGLSSVSALSRETGLRPGMPFAELPRRAAAALLDAMAIVALTLTAIAAASSLTRRFDSLAQILGAEIYLVVLAAVAAIGLLYYLLFEGFTARTPGKVAFGLAIRRTNGEPCGWIGSLLRNLLRPVDALGFYLLGFVVAEFSARRQRIGDFAASTVVVNRPLHRGLRYATGLAMAALCAAAFLVPGLASLNPIPLAFTPLQPLPASVTVASDGALRAGNLTFVLSKEGGIHSGAYMPGKPVNVRYEVVGFGLHANRVADLTLTARLLDPGGTQVDPPQVTTARIAARPTTRIVGWSGQMLPFFAPAGSYRLDINIHDNISGANFDMRPTVQVDGVTRECSAPQIFDAELSLTPDGPAITHAPAAAPRIYHYFSYCGVSRRNGHFDVVIGERILTANGRLLGQAPAIATNAEAPAYVPTTWFDGFRITLTAFHNRQPADYIVQAQVTDRITGKTAQSTLPMHVDPDNAPLHPH